jgi:hypothetical protein
MLPPVLLPLLWTTTAGAYTVGSSLSRPCHERITGRTFFELTREFAMAEDGIVPVPQSDTWQLIADSMIRNLGVDPAELNEMQRFIMLSLVVGVRSPDTDGHSLLDLRSLRAIHGDPSDEGQYSHCLRGRADDGPEGDVSAVAGTRRLILDRMDEAWSHFSLSDGRRRVIRVSAYLDFYGSIEVQVYAPFYYVGQALHALQDSFSHALRSDDDGLRTVVSVLNYIDAISSDFDERRDGLAHSDSLDRCGDPAADDLTAAARAATRDFVLAVRQEFSGADPDAVEAVLDAWLTYRPGCTFDNDYCGGGRWLDLLREEQTRPYLEAFFGCSAVPRRPGPGAVPTFLLLLGLARAVYGPRSRRRTTPASSTGIR